MPKEEDNRTEVFVDALAEIMSQTFNEPALRRTCEEFMNPAPAKLAKSKDDKKKIQDRMNEINRQLGGPPNLIFLANGSKPKHYDTYPAAAIDQILCSFSRSRVLVSRAHMCFVGATAVKKNPEFWKPLLSVEQSKTYYDLAIEQFWEHAENCFIRMASLWDRVGQLLDFIFFNIRQYERDGFTRVFERIKINIGPMMDLKSQPFWSSLNEYVSSEREDGLKWLLRRRNLLVHSMHLYERSEDSDEDPLFVAEYNHLEENIKKKLKLGTALMELDHIHTHLRKFVECFPNVLDLCEFGIQSGKDRRSRFPAI